MKEIVSFISNSLNRKVVSSTSGGCVGALWLITFDNATHFYIECAWRLSKGNKVVVTDLDGFAPKTGRITTLVPLLEGRTLRSFSLSKFYDLILFFDEDYCVKIFCDKLDFGTEHEDIYLNNWYYAHEDLDKVVEINAHFQPVWGKFRS